MELLCLRLIVHVVLNKTIVLLRTEDAAICWTLRKYEFDFSDATTS